jgi:hypothetical protein
MELNTFKHGVHPHLMKWDTIGVVILGVAILLISATGRAEEQMPGDTMMQLSVLLPQNIAGWAPAGPDEVFTRETIFDYMDGAGEVYLAYDFDHLLVREYVKPSAPPIVAEVYQMASSEDAYGIFTHDTDGEEVELGADAIYSGGYLRFWKGTFFVRLLAEKETEDVKIAVMTMGKTIAAAITQESKKPVLTMCLPSEGLLPKEVRYFHQPISLDIHYYLADTNILNLDAKTEVVLARYQKTGQKVRLLLVGYQTVEDAQKACEQFIQVYLKENPSANSQIQVKQVERGEFVSARHRGRFVILVFEAKDQVMCERLTQATENTLEATFK